MQVDIPVPRVPSPKITAPPAASDWDQLLPPRFPPGSPETGFAETLDHAGWVIPDALNKPLWGAVKRINHVLFRSPPPNPPVPEHEGSWKFSAIGDYGGGHSPQPQEAKSVAAGNPDLILTLGDNVYYTGVEGEWQQKWDPPEMFGDLRRNFPIMPSLGNHDLRREPDGVPYFKRFPELGGNRYYSFDHKGVHFVSVNSNESLEPGSTQLRWIEQDLAKSQSDWKVLFFHHPLFAGGPGDLGKTKDYLGPIIAKYGVDLVLTGHEHNYQRSRPINENGTIEVIAGGGGQSLHPFIKPQPAHNAYRDVDFGHVEVEVAGDELIGRYVVIDGSVRDTWVIHNNTPGHPATGAAVQAGAGAGAVTEPALPHPDPTPATVSSSGVTVPATGSGEVAETGGGTDVAGGVSGP
ncbi:MAG: phoA [Thermoleophilia bacterium]|nr:phoA [Thermoleophilia bacterium]